MREVVPLGMHEAMPLRDPHGEGPRDASVAVPGLGETGGCGNAPYNQKLL